jgi:hypothetical protein
MHDTIFVGMDGYRYDGGCCNRFEMSQAPAI